MNRFCNLPVLSPWDARIAGFESITNGVHVLSEKGIAESMASGREPGKAVWIHVDQLHVELAVHKSSIRTEAVA